jgi:hypothetical protein
MIGIAHIYDVHVIGKRSDARRNNVSQIPLKDNVGAVISDAVGCVAASGIEIRGVENTQPIAIPGQIDKVSGDLYIVSAYRVGILHE